MKLSRFRREIAAAAAFAVLLIAVGIVAPAFFSPRNLADLAVNSAPALLVAIGMTLVILTGEIDISVGSQFAVTTVAAGLLANAGVPMPLLVPATMLVGAFMGAINGALVAWLGLSSIIVTLATLDAWRDALRWLTQGAWIQGLPATFQWAGLGQTSASALIVIVPLVMLVALAWALHSLRAGRSVYAVGSDAEAARLAGIEPRLVRFAAFALTGALVGLAALLNAIRFSTLPSNAGVGLELKSVAAVVVGGAAITGGRGTLAGTLIGLLLLSTIGTALTYVGINPFWEKAIQGLVILAALVADVGLDRLGRRPSRHLTAHVSHATGR